MIEFCLKVFNKKCIVLWCDKQVDTAVAGNLHAHGTDTVGVHALKPCLVEVIKTKTFHAMHVVHAFDVGSFPARRACFVLGNENIVENLAMNKDHVPDVQAAHKHVQSCCDTRVRFENVLHDLSQHCAAVKTTKQCRGAAF